MDIISKLTVLNTLQLSDQHNNGWVQRAAVSPLITYWRYCSLPLKPLLCVGTMLVPMLVWYWHCQYTDTSITIESDGQSLTLKHREMYGCIVSTVATDALVLKHQANGIHNAGWQTKNFWHLPELGSLLYSLYKIPLVQSCFPLARPNFTRIGER